MHKKIFFSLLISAVINSVFAGSAPLTPLEISALQSLGCKEVGYHYQDGYLVIGDTTTKKNNAIFLIKNISANRVAIDYPAAHIGASAGLTQCLNSSQWAGYHYIKGQDKLRTSLGKQKPEWQCNAQNKQYKALDDRHQSYCDTLLYVCMITKSKMNGNPLQKNAFTLLAQKPAYMWFTASNSDSACYAVNTLQKVLIDIKQ